MPTLTPHLGTIDQVYQKVLREHHRALHSMDSIHKADHFYNFCITAHSLRDYFVKHKGWGRDGRGDEQYAEWNANEVLRAVKDIANSAKHFILREQPETRATEEATGAGVEVYDAGGELSCVKVVIPDFVVTMASGEKYHLWEIMSDVIEYWRQFLTETGIPLATDPHYFPDEPS